MKSARFPFFTSLLLFCVLGVTMLLAESHEQFQRSYNSKMNDQDDSSSEEESTNDFNLESWVQSNVDDSNTNRQMVPLSRMRPINFTAANILFRRVNHAS
ncbi:hypothetical protein WUBG_09246 [Wuchereria bancrofti]|uniref:Uncharacterized protein n=1 Tax=Wuchereria bancrofti TaxID=6293 RepID=J9EBP6_WUCBA|nr:hypothetical protein WUBG_09246 [Wuchereria bancrofti]